MKIIGVLGQNQATKQISDSFARVFCILGLLLIKLETDYLSKLGSYLYTMNNTDQHRMGEVFTSWSFSSIRDIR